MSVFQPSTDVDIKQLITKCSSKYCLLDPAPTQLVKQCLDILLPAITKIVNLSLTEGYFPANWKCSVVIPLIKKPNNDRTLQNYRPVSNLSFLSKVVEKVAVKRYQEHLTINNQLPALNAAYKQHHSSETI